MKSIDENNFLWLKLLALSFKILQKKKLGHLPCFRFKTSEPSILERTS